MSPNCSTTSCRCASGVGSKAQRATRSLPVPTGDEEANGWPLLPKRAAHLRRCVHQMERPLIVWLPEPVLLAESEQRQASSAQFCQIKGARYALVSAGGIAGCVTPTVLVRIGRSRFERPRAALREALAVDADDNPALRKQGIRKLEALHVLVSAVCHARPARMDARNGVALACGWRSSFRSLPLSFSELQLRTMTPATGASSSNYAIYQSLCVCRSGARLRLAPALVPLSLNQRVHGIARRMHASPAQPHKSADITPLTSWQTQCNRLSLGRVV